MSIDTATGKEAPADISSERVKDIFSTIAKKYERFNAVSSFGAYKTWLAGMMRQAPIDENADVLDIAGGTGDVTFTVARAKHPRHIQCTDLVDEMLDVARMHYEDGKAEGVPVDFEVVDAQHIPYADESYDAITMAYGIRNMPERDQALSEMFRVLKPGGQLVLGAACWPAAMNALRRWMSAGTESTPVNRCTLQTRLTDLSFEQVSWQRTGLGTGVMTAWKRKPALDGVQADGDMIR